MLCVSVNSSLMLHLRAHSRSDSLPSGHSHQLFHVSAVVGTHFQMEGVMADMVSRRTWLLAHGAAPSFLGTIGVLMVSLVLNLGIIGIFSTPLLWKPCHANSAQTHTSTTCERKEKWGRVSPPIWLLHSKGKMFVLDDLTAHGSFCLTLFTEKKLQCCSYRPEVFPHVLLRGWRPRCYSELMRGTLKHVYKDV